MRADTGPRAKPPAPSLTPGTARPVATGITRGFSAELGILVLALDVGAVLGLLYYFAVQRTGGFADHYVVLAAITAVLMPLVMRATGVSHRMRLSGWFLEATVLARAWVITLMCLVSLSFVTKTTELFSREAIVKWAVAGYLVQVLIHAVLRSTLHQLRAQGINIRYAVVVGRGQCLRDFSELLARNAWIGTSVVGTIDFDTLMSPHEPPDAEEIAARALARLEEILSRHVSDAIYFALPATDVVLVEKLAECLVGEPIEINWVPDLSSLVLLNSSVRELEGQPIICLSDSPLAGGRALIKRVEDIVLGTILLIISAPLMLAIALAIAATSGTPVLFRQKRGGLYGKPIVVWKFRTMRAHDEDGDVKQARREDPRVTPVGAFLRRTSLDELPQLVHVVTGRMSLVGPRPHAVEHDTQYGTMVDRYLLRYKIKPGITGWAQVNGWRGETEQVEKMAMRVAHDLYYIRNWSLGLDLKVIWLTITRMFADSRAY